MKTASEAMTRDDLRTLFRVIRVGGWGLCAAEMIARSNTDWDDLAALAIGLTVCVLGFAFMSRSPRGNVTMILLGIELGCALQLGPGDFSAVGARIVLGFGLLGAALAGLPAAAIPMTLLALAACVTMTAVEDRASVIGATLAVLAMMGVLAKVANLIQTLRDQMSVLHDMVETERETVRQLTAFRGELPDPPPCESQVVLDQVSERRMRRPPAM